MITHIFKTHDSVSNSVFCKWLLLLVTARTENWKFKQGLRFLDISHCVGPLVMVQRYQKWSFGMNLLCCGLLHIETDLVVVSALLMFLERGLSCTSKNFLSLKSRVITATIFSIECVFIQDLLGNITSSSYLKGLDGKRCFW